MAAFIGSPLPHSPGRLPGPFWAHPVLGIISVPTSGSQMRKQTSPGEGWLHQNRTESWVGIRLGPLLQIPSPVLSEFQDPLESPLQLQAGPGLLLGVSLEVCET